MRVTLLTIERDQAIKPGRVRIEVRALVEDQAAEMNEAIDAAARRQAQTTSEFLRQLVIRELRKGGVRLCNSEVEHAGGGAP